MNEFPDYAVSVDNRTAANPVQYSICTMVTKPAQYRVMVDSFVNRDFRPPDCEYLYIDNSDGNKYDSYSGFNRFAGAARGAYIVFCHQDIELLEDGRRRLDAVIAELDATDPRWGLFGNCGGIRIGKLAIRITDPRMHDVSINGPFPVRCATLDENFIVVRRDTGLTLPRDRAGFHFYGTELCLIAEMLGLNAYVVDFHLRHHSAGAFDQTYHDQLNQVVAKYESVLRPRWITAPCTDLFLSASSLLNRLLNRKQAFRAARYLADRRDRRGGGRQKVIYRPSGKDL